MSVASFSLNGKKKFLCGIDVGSTTVKVVILDPDSYKILFKEYKRHFSNVRQTLVQILQVALAKFIDHDLLVSISGSGGMEIASILGLPFVQEVIACSSAIKKFLPKVDVAIELGGEDAKLSFFEQNGIDQRMNETCAGGTGAFIDQMSTVMQTTPSGLDELASQGTTIYPIAARCGVFAKADIMPLLNEGVKREDIALSIFQSVVNQTIGGLACGYPIKGKVCFLGGPLSFLPQLRSRFIDTLKLDADDVVFPENSTFFVALGALLNPEAKLIPALKLLEKVDLLSKDSKQDRGVLDPLFKDENEFLEFKNRHSNSTPRVDLRSFLLSDKIIKEDKKLFIGIDAGSTTTKVVVINKFYEILWTHYASNSGSPLISTIDALKKLYKELEGISFEIACSGVTGYGEYLLKSALNLDLGEVETIAHYKAASFFKKDVSFILDIGGQDIKCIYIKNGLVEKIVLNEACSSGCGSFIETFAKSLSMDVASFASEACKLGTIPIDLGSRCTVFMNSKVKQAHKEGASISQIASGLAYSVIRNAFYKVIKLKTKEELGNSIVVQGGTFLNDSVLRAMEKICNQNVTRPDIAGLMGAFGMALISVEHYNSSSCEYVSKLIDPVSLQKLEFSTKNYRCKGCTNRCMITQNVFSTGKRFISGNRCEKMVKDESDSDSFNVDKKHIPDMYAWKYSRLFEYYKPLKKYLSRGTIGIPRVLNMYEDYPFWFSFFTALGYRVELSDPSCQSLYNSGIDTIPSQTVCFPAKLVHGHIVNLISKGISNIFYPCIQKEKTERGLDNHYNCPVVTGYPDLIRLNLDLIKEKSINYISDFLPLDSSSRLAPRLYSLLSGYSLFKDLSLRKVKQAIKKANIEMYRFHEDVINHGIDAYTFMKKHDLFGIVLTGRPYHIDPLINHGVNNLLHSSGVVVFSEDVFSYLYDKKYKNLELGVTNQWVYHSRMYKASRFICESKEDSVQLVQLNSFGCGLDAITTTQVEEILEKSGKIYTCLKIDEGDNISAIRIRIRSLLYAMREKKKLKENQKTFCETEDKTYGSDLKKEANQPLVVPLLKKVSKQNPLVLIPQLSPVHFDCIPAVFESVGFRSEVLPPVSKSDIEQGLAYIHNDACYPAVVVVSQIIAALKSGRYDLKNTMVAMFQTCGPCRATNYVSFIKKALHKEGLDMIPIFPINYGGLSSVLTKKQASTIIQRLMIGSVLGDLLLRITQRLSAYELLEGSVKDTHKKLIPLVYSTIIDGSFSCFKKTVNQIVSSFDSISIYENELKPKVGVVGEILIKYHPDANENLVEKLEKEGAEVIVPDITDFSNYCFMDDIVKYKYLSGSLWEAIKSRLAIRFVDKYRNVVKEALKQAKHKYPAMVSTYELASKVSSLMSLCHQAGEGWLLASEMVELIESGCTNIVCVQPFGCLPNHISGKGIIKELKRRYHANIAVIDYDPGTSSVNQMNRIKLMMSVAKEKLYKETDYTYNHNKQKNNIKSTILEKSTESKTCIEDLDKKTPKNLNV